MSEMSKELEKCKTVEELEKLRNEKLLGFNPNNEEECLEAIRDCGISLSNMMQYQTPQMCLEAVKNEGSELQFVKEQTPELCKIAVQSNPYNLIYVRDLNMLLDSFK